MATINPLGQPINYSVEVQNPFESALGGLKLGAGVADIQATQQKREIERQALEQAQARQVELQDLFKNPNATAADYRRVSAFLPKDQAAIVVQGFDAQNKEQQQETLSFGARAYSAIKSGNIDVAEKLLVDKAEALRNSGRKNEAATFDDYAKIIKLNPTGAQANIGTMMALLPGGDKFLENVDKNLATIAAEEKRPFELVSSQAKSEQDVIKAKYANENALAGLEKMAADLKLTNAQKNKVLTETSKLSNEVKKTALELEALKASGGVDPAKNFEQEEKLRKEYTARTKSYGEVSTILSNLEASANAKNGPGDIALITGFMKMLDPGSVVRETEFATAKDTAGLYQKLLNNSQKLQSGQLFALDSKQRAEYVALAKQYHDAAQKKAGEDKKALGVVVKNYKLNPDNVFGPEPTATPPTGNLTPQERAELEALRKRFPTPR